MTDKRVKVMNEVISGIRVIKMYAWEYAFRDVVAAIRRYKTSLLYFMNHITHRTEIYATLKYNMISAISIVYKTVSSPLIMFLVFSVYVNTPGAELTPRKVFVALSLITFVRFTSIHFFILCTRQVADARVAWIRIRVSTSSCESIK